MVMVMLMAHVHAQAQGQAMPMAYGPTMGMVMGIMVSQKSKFLKLHWDAR